MRARHRSVFKLDRVDRVHVHDAARVGAALGLGHRLAEVLAHHAAELLLRLVGVRVAAGAQRLPRVVRSRRARDVHFRDIDPLESLEIRGLLGGAEGALRGAQVRDGLVELVVRLRRNVRLELGGGRRRRRGRLLLLVAVGVVIVIIVIIVVVVVVVVRGVVRVARVLRLVGGRGLLRRRWLGGGGGGLVVAVRVVIIVIVVLDRGTGGEEGGSKRGIGK